MTKYYKTTWGVVEVRKNDIPVVIEGVYKGLVFWSCDLLKIKSWLKSVDAEEIKEEEVVLIL